MSSPSAYHSQPLFLVSFILISFLTTTASSSLPNTDEVALRAFRSQITHHPPGVFSSWNDSHHYCEWEGITCGRRHKRVTVLDLSSKNLHGTLSPHIGNLSFLKELYLYNNSFQGHIPPELGRLLRIPSQFVSLHNLIGLALFYNNLSGGIPSFLSNITSLEILHLGNNPLGGSIPKSLGRLRKLRHLVLQFNNLSGTDLVWLFNLTSLAHLNIGYNQLAGSLPPNLGSLLPNLQFLQLSLNSFSGTIPLSLSNCSKLEYLQMVGSLPNIGKLTALNVFIVSHNNLSGELPHDVGGCTSLEYLYMGGNMFRGTIPESLESVKGIREIDLSVNNLSGEIPKFLENLRLEKLNLSFNHFKGEVPRKGVFANSSAISVMGNNNLCGGIDELHLSKCLVDTSKKHEGTSLSFKILISIAAALLSIAMVSLAIFLWVRRRRSQHFFGSTWGNSLPKVSYHMLHRATDGFSPTHLIGRGSFGSVYKALLGEDGTAVAIKVLNLQRQGASRSFMAECKALRSIRHRNLVKVISSCASIDFQGNDFKAIVYEYMANGSLEKWLHQVSESEDEALRPTKLSFLQRLNITIDVASALDYLHNHCKDPILHCDLKPSNVLLDSDMTAHVGDFGLVKFLPETPSTDQSSTIGVKGTIGYTAPEYGLGSEVSTRGDVYSFGILLLEILTRKKPTDQTFEGDLNLHTYVKNTFPDNLMEIVDPELMNEELVVTGQGNRQALNNQRKECLISMVRIGVACSLESPQDRMNIAQVVNELTKIKNILLQPATILNTQQGE